MVAARGLIMSQETSEFVGGYFEQWHFKFPPFDICWGKCPHMQILRGGGVRGGANVRVGLMSYTH